MKRFNDEVIDVVFKDYTDNIEVFTEDALIQEMGVFPTDMTKVEIKCDGEVFTFFSNYVIGDFEEIMYKLMRDNEFIYIKVRRAKRSDGRNRHDYITLRVSSITSIKTAMLG